MENKIVEQKKALALKLFEINAIKFDDIEMKIGVTSPIYIDLRVVVSYPEVMETVSNLIIDYIKEHNLSAKHVCGVPYTALPLATLISIQQNMPMLILRKETKNYGTNRLIEGIYSAGDTCLIVEDVVASGASVLSTVKELASVGIIVTDAVVVVDREQGGARNIAQNSIKMHSLFTLSYLLDILLKAGKIDRSVVDSVAQYIASVQIDNEGKFPHNTTEIVNVVRTKLSFKSRANLAKCELAKQLFSLMENKKSNLCLAADLTKCQDVLEAADKCGTHICILKTHVDILEDFTEQFVNNLQACAKRHNFLLMEDRKFADIGDTISLQYGKGLYKISEWADLVTAHTLSGRSVLQALKAALNGHTIPKPRGVFLLAEMSTTANLIDDKYKEASNKIATEGCDVDFVAGMVCQSASCFAFPGLVQMTTGVKIDGAADQLDQKYNTPDHVIKEIGADVAVVGRGILQAKNMERTAALYRDRLWTAYTDRLSKE